MAGLSETIQEFGVKISLAWDEKAAKNAKSKIKSLGDQMKTLGLEIGALGAGLFAIANGFTSNARSLEDQAAQLGINTKALQEWEYAAKVAANVNRDELVDSMKTLGKFMDEARAGVPEATQALYDIAKAGGQDPAAFLTKLQDKTYKVTDAMRDLGDGLGRLSEKSPQAAARISELAFGTSKLMPMFKMGAKGMDQLTTEADRNFVLNEKMLRQGKEMDQQFTKVWLVFRKMGYEIGFNVMKHIQPLIAQFTKWFAANKKLIASGINEFLDQSVIVLKEFVAIISDVAKILGPVAEALGGTRSVVRDLFYAFLLFKGVQLGVGLVQAVAAIAGLIPSLLSIGSIIANFIGLPAIFAAITEAVGILGAMLGGVSVALFEFVAPILLIAAAITAIHDAYVLLSGGKKGDTWTMQGIDKLKAMTGFGANGPAALPGQNVTPSPMMNYGGGAGTGGGDSGQQANTFQTTNNITVPPGTSASAATKIISDATILTNMQMVKAQQDAANKRVR